MRYRFLGDDDGHHYLILEGLEKEFYKWLEAGPYWENYTGIDFSHDRINGSTNSYTFTDPQEDE